MTLNDDLRDHVLDTQDARESDPTEVHSARDTANRLIELLPALQDRLIEPLICLRETGDLLAPADRLPCPIDEGQFLPVDLGQLGE